MPSKRPMTSPVVYRLKITLLGVRPPIWRRLLVPGRTKLDRLHDIVQVGMGWDDGHLHKFEAKGMSFGVPSDMSLNPMQDERKARLFDLAVQPGDRFRYTYDFGDGWEHEVLLEEILDPEPGAAYPRCLTGRRACPPEDCGGPPGYGELLEILGDPSHEDHTEMLDWAGGRVDPDRFDLDRVNEIFARLR